MSRYEDSIRAAVYSLVGMVLLLLLAMLTSCKTRYVTVPEYHSEVVHDTDSVVRRDVVRDTSWMTIREVDSAELARLGVQIKGLRNALVIERNRNVEKISDNSNAKIRYIQKTDSVLVPYRVEVEKKLSWWDRVKVDFGGWAMLVLGLLVAGIGVAWTARRR